MKKKEPVRLVIRTPEREPGQAALARQVASIHAEAVLRRIGDFHGSADEKQRLRSAVIAAAEK